MAEISRLRVDNILFVFIDLQKKLLDKIPAAEPTINSVSMLLDIARILKIPAVVTTQYRKGLGDLDPEIADRAQGEVLDKSVFSCGADPGIKAEMERHRREWIVLAGVETHICVMQTALDLLAAGNHVAVVADGVAARAERDHDLGLRRMEAAGALLVSREMLIYELLGRANSPEFKQILPLIKGA